MLRNFWIANPEERGQHLNLINKFMSINYHSDVDFIWCATDINKIPALFITAGEGFIPFNIRQYGNMEKYIYDLPIISECFLHEKLPNVMYDSYIDLCSRGFYVFDWKFKDLKDSAHYQKIASPNFPCNNTNISSLPCDAVVRLKNCDFHIFDKVHFISVTTPTSHHAK